MHIYTETYFDKVALMPEGQPLIFADRLEPPDLLQGLGGYVHEMLRPSSPLAENWASQCRYVIDVFVHICASFI